MKRNLFKERNKQKSEAIYNLHFLKDITVDAFESHKIELKGMIIIWKLVKTLKTSYCL